MKRIKLLDCTLRDGGRVIDCKFKDSSIKAVSEQLARAKIDIIEIGFLRDIEFEGNSTFFSGMEDVVPYLNKSGNVSYVAFVDFGMFDVYSLRNRTKNGIDGIRYGFTKKDFNRNREVLEAEIKYIKNKGFDIYIQGVNTGGYPDKELLEVVEFANGLAPVSFGIVDTYGSMYSEDLSRLFELVNHNLKYDIAIDFHSHNNMQLSFSLAQEMIKLCSGKRDLIIDCTLNGMGKGAGNLNTELIVDYMNRKLNYNYDFDLILDTIDEYLYELKQEKNWGYTIPAFMSGIYKAHPNNIIYLTEKFKLATKDIRHIISMIDEDIRQSYDYPMIQEIFKEYSNYKVDDHEALADIDSIVSDRKVLLLVPGRTLNEYKNKIQEFVSKEAPVIFSVNFLPDFIQPDFVFFGNPRRYGKLHKAGNIRCIISSNIDNNNSKDLVINYHSVIEKEGKYFDNSTIMLLNLLARTSLKKLFIAGFDGFSTDYHTNFIDDSFYNDRFKEDFCEINEEIYRMLMTYSKRIEGKIKIKFITPSTFERAIVNSGD